jgi:hypothetical protein
MGTTPTSFSERKTTIKGAFGERIIKAFLEAKGFCVYEPTTEMAHAFDFLAVKDKRQCVALDVKSKARRSKYPDTGIDIRHYETYRDFSKKHKMPFFIAFVDEWIGKIYGNWLEKLQEPCKIGDKKYPSVERSIIYFPLAKMIDIQELSESDAAELRALSTRNYAYGAGL